MFKKNYLALILLSLLAVLTYRRWIFQSGIFGWADFLFFIRNSEVSRQLFSWPYIWDNLRGNGLGEVNILLSWYPLNFIGGLLTVLKVNSYYVPRIILLFPSLIIAPISSYLLIRHITKSIVGGLVGSVVFSYNSYFLLSQAGGVINITVAYGLAPLLLLLYIRGLETKKVKYLLLTAMVAFAQISYEFRIFYITAGIMFLYWIFHSILHHKLKIFAGAMPFILNILLNSYWLLPLYFSGSLSDNVLVNRGLFTDRYFNLTTAITFFHPFWSGGQIHADFTSYPVPEYLWLVPALCLLAFIKKRRDKLIGFFTIVYVLGIFLTKQSSPPFPGVYLWLFQHFPGFNVFREASKFYLVSALGISILLGSLAAGIYHKTIGKMIIGAIIAAFLINNYVIFTGKAGGMFTAKEIPSDYQILEKYLSSDKTFSRTLWVPGVSQWGYYDRVHPRMSLIDLYADSYPKLYPPQLPAGKLDAIGIAILNLLNQPNSAQLLSRLGIKYLIIPGSDYIDDDVFKNTGLDDSSFIGEYINRLGYLQVINIGTKAVKVYTLKDPEQMFYSDASDVSVESEYINPASYKVSLKNITAPVTLNFSQWYNRGWDLFLNSFADNKSIGYVKSAHQKSPELLNSYILDPEFIRKTYPANFYQINPDKSVNLNLSIDFTRQRLVNVGLVISGITAVIIFVILYKKWKNP